MAALISKGFSCVIFLIVLLSPLACASRAFKESHKGEENGTDAMLTHKKSGFGDMDCHGQIPGVNVPIPGVNVPGVGVNVPGLNIPGVSIPGGVSIGIPGVSVGVSGEVECPPMGGVRCGGCQLGGGHYAPIMPGWGYPEKQYQMTKPNNAQVAAKGQDVEVAN